MYVGFFRKRRAGEGEKNENGLPCVHKKASLVARACESGPWWGTTSHRIENRLVLSSENYRKQSPKHKSDA